MSRNTEFSVIIIACDVEPYIEQCIASVRRQILPDFEAVVGIEHLRTGRETRRSGRSAGMSGSGASTCREAVQPPVCGIMESGTRPGNICFFSTGTTGSRRMLWNSFMRRWRDMGRPI